MPLFWQIWRTGRRRSAALLDIQRRRLVDLVAYARTHSPFYRRHYRQVDPLQTKLHDLPPVTKPLLMASFDDWVTDPAVTRAGVGAFTADLTRVGQLFLDQYAVFRTSGTTGSPGIFLHDQDELAVYDRLWLFRGWLAWLGPWRLLYSLRRGFSEVLVAATGAHFAGATYFRLLRRRHPWLARRLHLLPVTLPLLELVDRLNALQPTILAIYPTALTLLMQAPKEARLSIRPHLIITSGEWLAPEARRQIAVRFGCPVCDSYSSSEFMYLAFSCPEGWLHVNADRLILEPVDQDYRPVPPGEPSSTVLLTNLANRVQPLIRYDLGDSLLLRPEPCPCGNPLPAVRVAGRRDEILSFAAADGSVVRVSPLALTTGIETMPGIRRYQLIQTGRSTLTIRLEPSPEADPARVWPQVQQELQAFLASQGVDDILIHRAAEAPRRDPRSGKFRQVWSEL